MVSSKKIELPSKLCTLGAVPDGTVRSETLTELEQQVISLCSDGVRVVGLPKSIGEIYGLFLISPEPLALDDLVERLQISKGSASQGLKMLRTLGAIRERDGSDARRAYYEADINLKRLAGGFIREEIRPHLTSGEEKLRAIEKLVAEESDPAKREFYEERIEKMERWAKQAKLVLPLLQRVLGE